MSSEQNGFPEKFAVPRGGPHGLGDPDDKRLRKVERDVLIQDKLKYAAVSRCKYFVDKFKECAALHKIRASFECRSENVAQMECISAWLNDEELLKMMTDEYLNERSDYRRTGIGKPYRGVQAQNDSNGKAM